MADVRSVEVKGDRSGRLDGGVVRCNLLQSLQDRQQLRSGALAIINSDQAALEIGLDGGQEVLELVEGRSRVLLEQFLHRSNSLLETGLWGRQG